METSSPCIHGSIVYFSKYQAHTFSPWHSLPSLSSHTPIYSHFLSTVYCTDPAPSSVILAPSLTPSEAPTSLIHSQSLDISFMTSSWANSLCQVSTPHLIAFYSPMGELTSLTCGYCPLSFSLSLWLIPFPLESKLYEGRVSVCFVHRGSPTARHEVGTQ